MGQAALADFLTDFGARPRSVPPVAAPVLTVLPTLQPAPPVPQVDIDAEIAKAVMAAEAELSERFEAVYEDRLATERAAHEAAMRDLGARLGTELGQRLDAALGAAEERIVGILSGSVSRILAQLATDAVAARAVGELARAVSEAIGDAEAVRVKVRGPQSMFMPLTVALGKHARHLELVESDGPDIMVTVDDTLFETRVSDWSRALDGIVG